MSRCTLPKSFPEVNEIDVQRGVPHDALLDDVSQHNDLIYASLASSESCLLLSQPGVNSCINSAEEESCKKPWMELTVV